MTSYMTDARREIVLKISNDALLGVRTRISATPDRAWLKRHGFIRSAPLNPPGARCYGGKGSAWHLTEQGKALAKAIGDELAKGRSGLEAGEGKE